MNKKISSKIISYLPQIVALLFIVGFAVYAATWQEPTQAPPGGNVATPLNVGTTPQSKAGRLSATEFYDYNDPNYYLNPSGNSNLSGNLTAGGNISEGGTLLSSKYQKRVSGTCSVGSSIREIAADGTVTCEADDVGVAVDANVKVFNGSSCPDGWNLIMGYWASQTCQDWIEECGQPSCATPTPSIWGGAPPTCKYTVDWTCYAYGVPSCCSTVYTCTADTYQAVMCWK